MSRFILFPEFICALPLSQKDLGWQTKDEASTLIQMVNTFAGFEYQIWL